MSEIGDVETRYLELALRLRRLEPDLVECYTGPGSLAEAVESEPPPTARALRQSAVELRCAVDDAVVEPDRRAWLAAQLDGLETGLRHLGGERVPYRTLVRRCHGVDPELVCDDQFAAAHALLAEVLPGSGDVRRRAQEWTDTQLVAPDLLLAGLTALANELQRRTHQLIGLPPGEDVTFELVRDRPWSGNADYLGHLRTRIRINADRRTASFRLLELVTHEAYPGHHTEHVRKDLDLIGRLGRSELGVYLYPTPQVVVAEGIAQLGLEVLLGAEADTVGAQCLRPLGIPYDIGTAAVYRRAEGMLRPIGANIAMLLDDGRSADEMRCYARRWALEDDEFIDGFVESLIDDRWPAYESCYAESLPLCRSFVGGNLGRFGRLLREQLTPADLDGRE
ncbi:MAG TPA: hypothetical protein VGN29_00440 [Solirubrobacteraceae bacterium]|nr:hypothetical protein [Solirubrobacteraceae bacterium]